MFHLQQLVQKIKSLPIYELLFYFFVFSTPFQTRVLLNASDAYIDYYFSYNKAIFFYASDIFFIAFILTYLIFSNKKLSIWFLLPFLWSLANVFHVESYSLWLFGSLKVLQFWLILAFIKQNPTVVRISINILILTGLLQAVLAVLQFHTQGMLNLWFLGEYTPEKLMPGAATLDITGEKILRSYGTFAHPNVLGGFLALIAGLTLYVSRETNRKWLIFAILFILIWGLIVSFSRSAWIGFLLSVSIYLGYQLIRKNIKYAILTGFFLIVSCGTLVYSYRNVVFPRAVDSTSNSAAADYREQYNSYGFKLTKEQPLIGHGSGQYILALESLKLGIQPWEHQPAHIISLYLLGETGILGLFIWFFTWFKQCFTWNTSKTLAFALLPSILVISALDHYLLSQQQGLLMFPIVLGIIFANKTDVSQSETDFKRH